MVCFASGYTVSQQLWWRLDWLRSQKSVGVLTNSVSIPETSWLISWDKLPAIWNMSFKDTKQRPFLIAHMGTDATLSHRSRLDSSRSSVPVKEEEETLIYIPAGLSKVVLSREALYGQSGFLWRQFLTR